MTKEKFKIVAAEKLNQLTTLDLIEKAKELTAENGLVLNSILDILIERLSENDFLELCESL